jgi:polar amino acid transport system substrate-binding protein
VRHEDGSVSNVSYQAGGDRAAPTERVEVYGGGRTAFIDEWDLVSTWRSERLTEHRTGKDRGNAAGFRAFIEAARGGGSWPIPWAEIRGTALASILAVRSLREGIPLDLRADHAPDAAGDAE